MKHLSVLAFAVCLSSVAWGQDYVGLSWARARFTEACPGAGDCASGVSALKLVVGSAVDGERWRAWGLNGYELSYIRSGRTSHRYTAPLPQQSEDSLSGASPLVYGAYNIRRQSSALTAAAVARWHVLSATDASARLGLAYVTTSATRYINEARNGEETASHVQPYLGLGLEQQVLAGTKIVVSADWTQYTVSGHSGSWILWGLGVQQMF